MRIQHTGIGKVWACVVTGFPWAVSLIVIVGSLLLFVYPAIVVVEVAFDSQLATTGEVRRLPDWFTAASPRFLAWADEYLDTRFAASLRHDDVAPTEWPMFGAVFFLVTAQEIHDRGRIDAAHGVVREAVEKAAEIVASPTTATWVRTKWGDDYLKRENVFYRMLLILGLSSYEKITGDARHHALMARQRETLAAELAAADHQLLDDYPGECYPADMLWAVAAIQRADRLDGQHHDPLAQRLMAVFDGPIKTAEGLPAFQADARSGNILQNARGCGNSGILLFAGELDPHIAERWYTAYVKGFWIDKGWIAGFSEMPIGSGNKLADVDSGPVLFGIGSAASAFGIGAAKASGRFDHAAPLTIEAVACSWPTPFGLLIPGLMGRLAAKSWSLGEVALLFSMSRPARTTQTVPFTGHVPWIAWICVAAYLSVGTVFLGLEARWAWRRIRGGRSSPKTSASDRINAS